MKIILANGTELSPISAMGAKRTVQGANRDTLSFCFPATASVDELNSIFTASNCETITIVEGENQYVHNAYTIRAELKREPVEVKKATTTEAPVYEDRVVVSMAQRTYAESKIAEMQAVMNALLNEEG